MASSSDCVDHPDHPTTLNLDPSRVPRCSWMGLTVQHCSQSLPPALLTISSRYGRSYSAHLMSAGGDIARWFPPLVASHLTGHVDIQDSPSWKLTGVHGRKGCLLLEMWFCGASHRYSVSRRKPSQSRDTGCHWVGNRSHRFPSGEPTEFKSQVLEVEGKGGRKRRIDPSYIMPGA